MPGERILVVDDEPGVRSALQGILADEGFEVTLAETGEAGLEVLDRESFDVVFLDVWLPGIDGLTTLERLRRKRFDCEVVMISGHGTIETAVSATKLGAYDFVEKPLSLDRTLLVLRNALRQRRLERRNRQLLERLSRDTEILGRSAAAEKLRREVRRAAASRAAVLLIGEPGSGREGVARQIHNTGGDAGAPFVDVPCAALHPARAAAALFGEGDLAGRISLAADGTLYLEEVNRLEPDLQEKLAAALGERKGGLRMIGSIAETRGELIPALRQLLEVARIRVPALRERRDDIPLLVERFMHDLSREYSRQPRKISPEALAALRNHDWPGNVQELRNLTERLLLFAEGEVIHVRDLPEGLGGDRGPVEDLYRDFDSLEQGRRAFERYYIARVLALADNDLEKAARRLGIPMKELSARMEGPT